MAEWYRFFAEVEAKESSPTYRVLANGVADDEVVLGHLARLPAAKRQPNLLFAAVQFLDGPTANWLEVRRFMLSRWDDIAALMATRSTQTNEAARCAAFLPVLASIRSPIALIEVGAAAGLCLFPDRYSYSYSHTVVGDSPVRIDVECTGAVPVPVEMPDICWRSGIDLNPLDVTVPADVKWLRACIWPEHDERRDRFERAAKIAADDPPTIIAGDLNSEIDAVLASAPTDAVIVVFHSAVLAYLAVEQRQAFAENMTSRHEVIWLSNESPGVIADLASPQRSLKPNAFLLGRNGRSGVVAASRFTARRCGSIPGGLKAATATSFTYEGVLADARVASRLVTLTDFEACPLPKDSLLAEMASALRDAGHWAEIVDPEWRVVYTTDELRLAQGFMVEPAPLTLGMHMFGEECVTAAEQLPGGDKMIDIARERLASIGEWVVADTPGGHDALRSIVDPRLTDVVDQLVATNRTVASSSVYKGVGVGSSRPVLDLTVTRIRDTDGRLAGTVIIQKPHVSMSMLATLGAMGDAQHFARMQSVAAAGRRPAAILFADLEGSSSLARRLSTERYFALGRRMTRAADSCIVEAGGITGRHVGDGVVAFFIAENFGSESSAVAGAISAARALTGALAEVAVRSDLAPEDLAMRFGLHWGSTVYIGLISSVGRTEVTALGDEVNECARIEACATGGRTLASKSLIERLTPEAAADLGVDTNRVGYIQLGELSTATDKARRDAPYIAVCEL